MDINGLIFVVVLIKATNHTFYETCNKILSDKNHCPFLSLGSLAIACTRWTNTCSFHAMHNPTRIPPCWNMCITPDQILGMELGVCGIGGVGNMVSLIMEVGQFLVQIISGMVQRQQLWYMNSEMWQNVYSEIKMHSIAFFFLGYGAHWFLLMMLYY